VPSSDDTQAGAPQDTPLLSEFHTWLADVVARQASDLHLKAGAPPKVRDPGRLVPLGRDASSLLEHR
jgi:Tfp pilus assembly pilus retraction ATPase PilT